MWCIIGTQDINNKFLEVKNGNIYMYIVVDKMDMVQSHVLIHTYNKPHTFKIKEFKPTKQEIRNVFKSIFWGDAKWK